MISLERLYLNCTVVFRGGFYTYFMLAALGNYTYVEPSFYFMVALNFLIIIILFCYSSNLKKKKEEKYGFTAFIMIIIGAITVPFSKLWLSGMNLSFIPMIMNIVVYFIFPVKIWLNTKKNDVQDWRK